MKRLLYFTLCMVLAGRCAAQTVGSIAQVAIVDRDSGAVLSPHYYRGEYWVAGRPGARYAIQIRNRLGERVLAVTSVDGVNVISGATAGWDQTGYVFGSGELYQITGWRKSDAEVAAFTFTASPNSYAERTGRPANVGVIGVAVFRERPAVVSDRNEIPGQLWDAPAAPTASNADSALPRDSLAKAQTSRSAGAERTDESRAMSAMPALPAPKLGTGHGERESSYVNRTEFERLQNQPNEVIRIRYDSLENLFAMGIVKRPRPTTPNTNPFPASPDQQYAPDPAG